MKRLARSACIVLLAGAVVPYAVAGPPQTAATAQQAEQALLAAAGKGDAAAAGALLDAEFEWTTPVGVNHKRDETLANLSALADDVRGETGVQSYSYDHMVVITGVRPTSRFMRVWVQRPQGWRLFTMIDTAMVTGATPPFSVPTTGPAPDCDNPCRTIPFNPATPAQREMLDTFKLLKMDEWHPNPDEWAPYVLDDVYYVTSAAALSKADRVNRLAQQRQTGAASVPGDPVLFMRIVEFGQSAVMFARHAPFRGGKPFYSVRVWAFRDGKWRFANSQQTTIEAAAAAPAVQPRP
jgi:Domain of unknown function (DUF4440)